MDEPKPLRRRIGKGNRASKGTRSEGARTEPSNFIERLGIVTAVSLAAAAKARMT